jgi:hypothetical protein
MLSNKISFLYRNIEFICSFSAYSLSNSSCVFSKKPKSFQKKIKKFNRVIDVGSLVIKKMATLSLRFACFFRILKNKLKLTNFTNTLHQQLELHVYSSNLIDCYDS